jgi:hypothetical protein
MPKLSAMRAFIEPLKQEELTSLFGNSNKAELLLVDALVVGEAWAPVLR